MEKLWAPWRNKYILSEKNSRCIFCGNRTDKRDKARYIIDRTAHSFSMLNLYPYNNGHIMVAPFRHVRQLDGLSEEELIDLIKLVRKTKTVLDKKLNPHGYNIGMNIGKVSGAGFAGHIHIHIVPRWNGDTNFMPIISDTKVMAASLDAMMKKLRVD